jgi:hypothetical protein
MAGPAVGSHCAKRAYREVLEKLVDIFEADLGEPQRRERALAVVALCVGGIIAAKCMDDPAMATELRRAAHRHALRTGGWNRGQPSKTPEEQNS